MYNIVALGVLTAVSIGAYIKIGYDELKLIDEDLKRRERNKRRHAKHR